jgi:hypothetical protein
MKTMLLKKKCFEHNKPKIISILHVFDHTVKPVLLHGSEIWGIFDAKKINKVKDSYFNKICNNSRSHYGSKVPAVTITVFNYRN